MSPKKDFTFMVHGVLGVAFYIMRDNIFPNIYEEELSEVLCFGLKRGQS